MESISSISRRKRSRLLVTGGAGFIGSAFARFVFNKVESCIVLDLLTYAGNRENLSCLEGDPRFTFVHGDISDEPLVEELVQKFQIDAIVHFAAETHVDRSILGPKAFVEANILGTFHLLEVVRRHPHIHFHHVSTDEVYGCLGDEGKFSEESRYAPSSPYSASKAASDHLVRAYAKTYTIFTTLSHCSNNFGPYQFPEKLIPLTILNCLKKEPLPLYGEGKNVRDWLFVDDHAECVWGILERGKPGESYNIGGEQEVRNIDLVKKIIQAVADLTGTPKNTFEALITFVKDRPGHDWRYAIDCSKVKRDIGWHPSPSLDEKLVQTVQWFMNNPTWVSRVESGKYKQWIETHYQRR
jgi:dTDP-glucose 4,6-dehydratase